MRFSCIDEILSKTGDQEKTVGNVIVSNYYTIVAKFYPELSAFKVEIYLNLI